MKKGLLYFGLVALLLSANCNSNNTQTIQKNYQDKKVTLKDLAEKPKEHYGTFEINVTSCCFFMKGMEGNNVYNIGFSDKFSGNNVGMLAAKLYSNNSSLVEEMVREMDNEAQDGDNDPISIRVKIQKTTPEESHNAILLKGAVVNGRNYTF